MKRIVIALATAAALSACSTTVRERVVVDTRSGAVAATATDSMVNSAYGSRATAGDGWVASPAFRSEAEWRGVAGTGAVSRPVMPGS